MTDLRIVYNDQQGRMVVLTPAPKARKPGEDEAVFVSRIAEKDVPDGIDTYRIVHKNEVPARS